MWWKSWLVLVMLVASVPVRAQVMIRDAETEAYIREIADPIFEAAGLFADNVQIHLIKDRGINAFVAGGQHLFVHTGLIQQAANSDVIAGVIAHETGHIRGGHLLQKRDQAESSFLQMTVGTVIGLVAGAVSGSAEAGAAIAGGAQHIATRGFLAHSRSLEASADQAALELLAAVRVSPVGLMALLDSLLEMQKLQIGDVDEYATTHPPSRLRMEHIGAYLAANPERNYAENPALAEKHQMIVAKLNGFLGRPESVIERLGEQASLTRADRYALAIAHYRLPDIEAAIGAIDQMILRQPDNAYLHELQGQIFYEHGRVGEAILAYQRAYEIDGRQPLFALGLGLAYLAQAENSAIGFDEAERYLRQVTVLEPKNAFAWQRLGVAYGRQGKLGHSYVALAEGALLRRNQDAAERYVRLAKPHVVAGSMLQRQMEDVERAVALEKDEK